MVSPYYLLLRFDAKADQGAIVYDTYREGMDDPTGLTHESLSSYVRASAEETTAGKAPVFPVDTQAGGIDFRLELGTNESHA